MNKVYLLVEAENAYEADENIIAAFDFKPSVNELTDAISGRLTGGKCIDVEEYKALHEYASMCAQGVLTGGFSDQSLSYTLEEMELITKEAEDIAEGFKREK